MEKVHRHRHRRLNLRKKNEETLAEEQSNDEQFHQEQMHHQPNSLNRNIDKTSNIGEHRQQQENPSVLINGHDNNIEKDIESVNSTSRSNIPELSEGVSYAVAAVVALNEGSNGDSIKSSKKNTDLSASRRLQLTPHGSPRLPSVSGNSPTERYQVHRGIMGFMDRELKDANINNPGRIIKGKKAQSLSDPQASPAQRSTRSRNSLEKSPRRKRSKSESRRRRERKLIAAGEMEVRQANETLMRYLKQVSDMHDASLSGELEIDHNFDERRVHRKTKSQRDKRGHLICKTSGGKLYATGGGLSSILTELSEDIIPAGREIYNPFTPVVSPTEGPPSRIDKMFIQTSSGYRAVDHCFYKNPLGSDTESNKQEINNSVNLSCALQRIWIMIANICHGLLGGLALAHLLFIVTSRPFNWSNDAIHQNFLGFAEIYANMFYCFAIICLVSVFDRMDICHIDISNASELISFRWIIISMIYIATIILTLCSETMDEKLYMVNHFNLTIEDDEMANNKILNAWNSLTIARSFGAIIGWIMIGLSQDEDSLYGNLLEMEKYQLTNN